MAGGDDGVKGVGDVGALAGPAGGAFEGYEVSPAQVPVRTARLAVANDCGRNSYSYRVWRYVVGHDRASSDNASGTEGHVPCYYGVGTNPDVVLNHDFTF